MCVLAAVMLFLLYCSLSICTNMQVFYEAGVKMSFSLKFIDPGLLLVIEENLIFWKI